MKKMVVLLMALTLVFAMGSMMVAFAGVTPGPAPNSGDGIPDGSGWDEGFPGPNGVDGGTGPAPNSGDGIPDGSGF